MCTKNNLKLLDMDEKHREEIEYQMQKKIAACKELGLVLDMASSDVFCFVENQQGENLCIG